MAKMNYPDYMPRQTDRC